MSDTWKVRQYTGQHGGKNGRVLFEGLEEDARVFVENNFPRPHIEAGGGHDEVKADVHLVSPNDVREHLLNNAWFFVEAEEE